jgi:hypothetical protein
MNRKELIRQYKETPRPMGVYRVRNAQSGRSLVGASPTDDLGYTRGADAKGEP